MKIQPSGSFFVYKHKFYDIIQPALTQGETNGRPSRDFVSADYRHPAFGTPEQGVPMVWQAQRVLVQERV